MLPTVILCHWLRRFGMLNAFQCLDFGPQGKNFLAKQQLFDEIRNFDLSTVDCREDLDN